MDYGRVDLAERLAADYVVGTMRGGARRRFESLLPAHAALRDATLAWQERLMPLSGAIVPVAPPDAVWQRVLQRIDGGNAEVRADTGAWHRLSFWRGLTAFASIAVIGLAALLANPRAVPPPVIVVLAPTGSGGSDARPGTIVASISGDGATLVTRPLLPVAVRADRALELWAVPATGAPPRSLGVLPGSGSTVALRGDVMRGVDTLAVTIEPPGGSPTGAPTGPIVFAGKFSL